MPAAPSSPRYHRRAVAVVVIAGLTGAFWTASMLSWMFREVWPVPVTELHIGDMRFAVPAHAQRYVKADAKTLTLNLYQERDLPPLIRCWRVDLLIEAEPVRRLEDRRSIGDPSDHPGLATFEIPQGMEVSAVGSAGDSFDFRVPGAMIKGRPVTVTCSARQWQFPLGLSGHSCNIRHALTDEVRLSIGFNDNVVPLSSWPKLVETAERVVAKHVMTGDAATPVAGAASDRGTAPKPAPSPQREPALECPRS